MLDEIIRSISAVTQYKSPLTRCQTFWCNCAVNNFIKSTLMFNVAYYQVQKSACMQSSATVGRTDTMYYRPCIAAWHWKVGGPCTPGPPHCQKVGGQDLRTPTGSPPLAVTLSCDNPQINLDRKMVVRYFINRALGFQHLTAKKSLLSNAFSKNIFRQAKI